MTEFPDASSGETEGESSFTRASSVLELMPQTEAEMDAIRDAVITREGLLLSVFDVLRKVPRRVLMVFKLNDLTRQVDCCSIWRV